MTPAEKKALARQLREEQSQAKRQPLGSSLEMIAPSTSSPEDALLAEIIGASTSSTSGPKASLLAKPTSSDPLDPSEIARSRKSFKDK
jgi:hypothetical protein